MTEIVKNSNNMFLILDFTQSLKMAILNNDNFFNLRIYGIFDHDEWNSRFIKSNILRYINKEKIIQMFDERFFRMWEFYLAGCEMAFKWGDQVVYQFQLTKNYSSTPVTRDYIYQ